MSHETTGTTQQVNNQSLTSNSEDKTMGSRSSQPETDSPKTSTELDLGTNPTKHNESNAGTENEQNDQRIDAVKDAIPMPTTGPNENNNSNNSPEKGTFPTGDQSQLPQAKSDALPGIHSSPTNSAKKQKTPEPEKMDTTDADTKISSKSEENEISGGTSVSSCINMATDKIWLDLQYHEKGQKPIKKLQESQRLIMKPHEIADEMEEPDGSIDPNILNKVQGSIIGMALGDALGAHVEFRPRQFLDANPVKDLQGGGTWGLSKGQFTDDTSMALCLANSLVACCDFDPYDQLVRYKWWYKYGYMSSTGQCFDIGAATRNSLVEFENRQREEAKKLKMKPGDMDALSTPEIRDKVDVYCSEKGVAGNGALMRLAPVPLFFYKEPAIAVERSGISGQITHGDTKAYDACRYYGALIVAALWGENKNDILDKNFYLRHKEWFGGKPLCKEIMTIAEGSFKRKGGYDEGIRGKGYIVNALEAALWAFWDDKNSFETGALKAVNLGDDTDTTAAIYGQLAGAYYGYSELPDKWLEHVYAKKFMEKLSKWIAYEGQCWYNHHKNNSS